MKFFKNGKYKICVVLLLTVVLFLCTTTTYAAINNASSTTGFADTIKDILGVLINTVGMGVLGSTIVPLINFFSILIFLILYVLFVGSGAANGLAFPFPDQIIFNRIALLDPNFINPAPGSVGELASGAIKNMYSSFFVLATTIFTIAALVIGIKLVFSSLAAEKAQYKKALNTWIVGIVMLFLVHYLLAGMFYLNEKIVEAVSNVGSGIVIPFDLTDALPGKVGKAISSVVKGFSNILGFNQSITTVDLHGYGGIVLMYAIKAFIGQDLISSIVFLIIIGETFALMISYLKRAFMCIILGMVAPLIVAVDVIQKSLK